jgi:cobalt/nickel transport protein
MRNISTKWLALGILVVALVLAGVVSYYASSEPDGLNRVAQDHGFSSAEKHHATADSPLAGYSAKDVDNPRLSGGLAGVAGVVVVLALAGGLALVVRRRKPVS